MMKTAGLAMLAGCACAQESMSFLAIGDWGGNSDSSPTTGGEIDNNKGMGAVADKLGAKFVMAVGDNIYGAGVHNAESVRFKESFEDVFTHPALQCPWYVIAGNHDHGGNVTGEIAYTELSPTKRWKFPSLYYTFNQSFTPKGGKTVTTQVVYIDTVVLHGMSYHDEENDVFVAGEGPANQAEADTQLEWVEETLKASTADYLWVSGHYPMYSQCSHGPTSSLQKNVLPLMQKYKASGFIAGHDHCLGHFQDNSTDMAFVVTGAGKSCCYSPTNIDRNPKGYMTFRLDSGNKADYGNPDAGFASFTVTGESTTITYYDSHGNTLYTASPVPARHL